MANPVTSGTTTKATPTLNLYEFVALMAMMTSLVALSIDSMLPALSQIGQALQAKDDHEAHLIVSIFFAGMAFGQLFFGPYSDARGRRETILVGLCVFGVGTLVCMQAQDMNTMLAGRLIQAFGVSGPRIAAMAIIRDLYVGDAMARVMSFIMMVFILVPMLAPVVGQAVLYFFSWQHIFTLFLVVAFIAGSWFFSRQPETLPATRRAAFSWRQFWRSSGFILTHMSVMGYTLAMGCIFGAFLAYLSASQTIFQEFYHTGELFPYIFATLAFSIGLASFFNGTMVVKLGMTRLIRVALIGVIVFALVFNAILWFYKGLPPLAVTISVMFCGFFFVGILFGNLNAMAMEPLGDMAGLGAAIIGSLSSMIAVPVALFIDSFLTSTLTPIGIGFLVFFVLAAVAVKTGERSRQAHGDSLTAEG
ncbi:multidrug effflux MFS transporter [Salinimonas sediminis]|uniref:Bcr/CflA family efflux transporter n=1 Tax=Salinimonas sediminis TaxID=2303538 RepID=A0A346NHD9_9ALTE|nr:multidrug effflux MFS transporter [Salinimonas sediminis]AXR04946.1 Bcr/CflA family efflux MFS transporter [Salinimonas sediminis]